jgi:hypothetical protein
MTRKEVIQAVLSGKRPPYVPWALGFTQEAREKLVEHKGEARVTSRCGYPARVVLPATCLEKERGHSL